MIKSSDFGFTVVTLEEKTIYHKYRNSLLSNMMPDHQSRIMNGCINEKVEMKAFTWSLVQNPVEKWPHDAC